mmetsp:Transcript_32632/g.64935  ORF Transcript_32632/g.64935 Transcript_32632/m.64935 type:complete len:660 (-) Transcript_32632:190-2169(-)
MQKREILDPIRLVIDLEIVRLEILFEFSEIDGPILQCPLGFSTRGPIDVSGQDEDRNGTFFEYVGGAFVSVFLTLGLSVGVGVAEMDQEFGVGGEGLEFECQTTDVGKVVGFVGHDVEGDFTESFGILNTLTRSTCRSIGIAAVLRLFRIPHDDQHRHRHHQTQKSDQSRPNPPPQPLPFLDPHQTLRRPVVILLPNLAPQRPLDVIPPIMSPEGIPVSRSVRAGVGGVIVVIHVIPVHGRGRGAEHAAGGCGVGGASGVRLVEAVHFVAEGAGVESSGDGHELSFHGVAGGPGRFGFFGSVVFVDVFDGRGILLVVTVDGEGPVVLGEVGLFHGVFLEAGDGGMDVRVCVDRTAVVGGSIGPIPKAVGRGKPPFPPPLVPFVHVEFSHGVSPAFGLEEARGESFGGSVAVGGGRRALHAIGDLQHFDGFGADFVVVVGIVAIRRRPTGTFATLAIAAAKGIYGGIAMGRREEGGQASLDVVFGARAGIGARIVIVRPRERLPLDTLRLSIRQPGRHVHRGVGRGHTGFLREGVGFVLGPAGGQFRGAVVAVGGAATETARAVGAPRPVSKCRSGRAGAVAGTVGGTRAGDLKFGFQSLQVWVDGADGGRRRGRRVVGRLGRRPDVTGATAGIGSGKRCGRGDDGAGFVVVGGRSAGGG